MAEYIDRETLMRDIDETLIFSGRDGKISAEIRGANKVIDRIKICAVADVAPVVHGKWIDYSEVDEDGNRECHCSVCYAGDVQKTGIKVLYCWKCGAKMDLEDSNES